MEAVYIRVDPLCAVNFLTLAEKLSFSILNDYLLKNIVDMVYAISFSEMWKTCLNVIVIVINSNFIALNLYLLTAFKTPNCQKSEIVVVKSETLQGSMVITLNFLHVQVYLM